MRIGYLPGADDAAQRLKSEGHDVRQYRDAQNFDVLLYNERLLGELFGGASRGSSAAPSGPMFLLNVGKLDDAQIDEQLKNRTYSKLFE